MGVFAVIGVGDGVHGGAVVTATKRLSERGLGIRMARCQKEMQSRVVAGGLYRTAAFVIKRPIGEGYKRGLGMSTTVHRAAVYNSPADKKKWGEEEGVGGLGRERDGWGRVEREGEDGTAGNSGGSGGPGQVNYTINPLC